jgi:hypothetical protein
MAEDAARKNPRAGVICVRCTRRFWGVDLIGQFCHRQVGAFWIEVALFLCFTRNEESDLKEEEAEMKKLTRLSLLCAVPVLAATFALPAIAAPNDIKTGDDLVKACQLSVDGDKTQSGRISATACNQYLAGVVVAVSNSTEAGKPLKLYRLGPEASDTVCFRLPDVLKYQEFAALVVDYSKSHPELGARPAVELAGRSLADKFPCPE